MTEAKDTKKAKGARSKKTSAPGQAPAKKAKGSAFDPPKPDKKNKSKDTKPTGKGPGRPSLYEEKKDLVIQYVQEGNYQGTAANMAGIHPETLIEWKKQYPEFSEAIKAAEAEAEAVMVKRIRLHSLGDWKPAAWYLERKFPDRWGKLDRIQIDKTEKETRDQIKEMSDDELIEFVRRNGPGGTEPTE